MTQQWVVRHAATGLVSACLVGSSACLSAFAQGTDPAMAKRAAFAEPTARKMPTGWSGAATAEVATGVNVPTRSNTTSGPAGAAGPAGPIASPVLLARLSADAETALSQRLYGEALGALKLLVELDPRNAKAWFRLGTVQQRGNDLSAAGDSYQQVLELATGKSDEGLRVKALLNVALMGVWRAKLALADLEGLALESGLRDERQRIEAELDVQDARLGGLTKRVEADITRSRAADGLGLSPSAVKRSSTRINDRRERAGDESGARVVPLQAWRPSTPVQHIQGMPGRGAEATADAEVVTGPSPGTRGNAAVATSASAGAGTSAGASANASANTAAAVALRGKSHED